MTSSKANGFDYSDNRCKILLQGKIGEKFTMKVCLRISTDLIGNNHLV